jgi:hypothetical protein
MQRTIRRAITSALLVFSATLAWPAPATAQIQGRVYSERRTPLVGATVWSDVGVVVTDSAGSFSLPSGPRYPQSTAHAVRVSMRGYRPMTRVGRDGTRLSFEMRLDADALWKPPSCLDPIAAGSVGGMVTKTEMYGGRVRLTFPLGTKVESSSELESARHSLCRGGDCLSFSWGPVLGDPVGTILSPDLIAGIQEMQERDISNTPNGFDEGAEFRGVRKDGTYFRWVGLAGETIIYDHATKTSAEFFDRILDSLCWVRPRDRSRR